MSKCWREPGAGKQFQSHQWVDHKNGEYVRGDVSTNQVEGYFSQLKRSIDGTHHRGTWPSSTSGTARGSWATQSGWTAWWLRRLVGGWPTCLSLPNQYLLMGECQSRRALFRGKEMTDNNSGDADHLNDCGTQPDLHDRRRNVPLPGPCIVDEDSIGESDLQVHEH